MPFNHFDSKGQAIMVDVSAKQPTLRTAVARSIVRMQPATLQMVLMVSWPRVMCLVWRVWRVLQLPRRLLT